LCNEIWEIYSFVHGFESDNARLSGFNYLKTRCASNTNKDEWNAPWLVNKRMKTFSKRGRVKLKFIQCCCPIKRDIRECSVANRVELIEE